MKHYSKYRNYSTVQSQWTLARLKSHEKNTKVSLEIRDFKGSRTNSIGSKGQTKNLQKRRHLNGLYSNNNSLKMAYI